MQRSIIGSLIEPVARISIAHRDKYAKEFLAVFGHHLCTYWTWHGFDVLAFAKHFSLLTDDKSPIDNVRERFGNAAASLIIGIIEIDFEADQPPIN